MIEAKAGRRSTEGWNWPVVIGAMLGGALGAGPIMVISFGVFLKPVSEAFGWDRSVLTSGLTLAIFMNALGTPPLGRLIDRYGVRSVTLIAAPLFALSFAALSLTSSSWTLLALLYGVMGLLSAGTATLPYVTAISATCKRNRGLALGVGLCGLGIGSGLAPPVSQYFIDQVGWRGAYLSIGAIAFVATLFIWAVLMKVPRQSPAERGKPTRSLELLKSIATGRHFWFLCLPVLLMSLATNGILANLVPMFTDSGMSAQRAAAFASLVGVATIVGKVSSGFLVDRFRPQWVAAGYFAVPILALLLLTTGEAGRYPALTMISIGLTHGSEVALASTLVARFFGMKNFGVIFGFTAVAFTIGVGLGPLLMSLTYDISGSYDAAIWILAAGLAAASLMIGSLPDRAVDEPGPEAAPG